MTLDPENALTPVALAEMRATTKKLSTHEWLAERVYIPIGYTAGVEALIETAGMHITVVTMLQKALEVSAAMFQKALSVANLDGKPIDEMLEPIDEMLVELRLAIDVASRTTFGTGAHCRCGWSGDGEHMCHRCHSTPGSMRVYQYRNTWSCDPCWATWKAKNGGGG